MMETPGNPANLRPVASKEEARERGRKGGIASAKARAARKTFAETLKAMLSCRVPRASPLYRRLKAQMRKYGIEWEPTVRDMTNLGMIEKAVKNPQAYCAIRDTIGEKPVEQTQDLTPPPPIRLGLLPVVEPVAVDGEESR